MKLYKSLLLLAAILTSGLWATSCSEDDSLENAGDVYIDIMPEKISMVVGDSLPISATVMSTSGKIIKTPIQWSLDDTTVVKLSGDTLVCFGGALDRGFTTQYTTVLRATLSNGKYAITTVRVNPAIPDGVNPVEAVKYSYNLSDDGAVFTVLPKSLLFDYEPTVKLNNDLLTLLDPELTVDSEEGTVTVHFSSPASSGECEITVSIGEGSNIQSGTCIVKIQPPVESSLWDDASGDGINDVEIRRMKMGELAMYRTFALTKTIDINSTSYAIAGVNVNGANDQSINAAISACHWEAVSGNSVLITGIETTDAFDDQNYKIGFDSWLRVTSGAMEGSTVFNFVAPDTVLEVTFRVVDFNAQPVNAITTNAPEGGIEMNVGSLFPLETGVEPMTSYLYFKPEVVSQDTTIVKVGEYEGNTITLFGVEEGQTNIVLTAKDQELIIPVKVNEGVTNITLSNSNSTAAFVGQTVTWTANVTTSSGKPNTTFPITWGTSDESIATATQGDDPLTTGVISAVGAGNVNVTAQVLGLSRSASLMVMAIPDDVTYTPDNTTNVTITTPVTKDRLFIKIEGTDGVVIEINLSGYQDQYDFNITDMSVVSMTYNGASITPVSGTLTGIDDGKQTTLTFELNFNIAGQTFTISASGLVA